jgi:hypothetical protein
MGYKGMESACAQPCMVCAQQTQYFCLMQKFALNKCFLTLQKLQGSTHSDEIVWGKREKD